MRRRPALTALLARAASRPFSLAAVKSVPADAICVLGAPVYQDGTLTPIVEERVRGGCELFRAELAPRLIFSGRGEAAPMAAHAARLGVPASAITIEDESRTTEENARFAARLLAPGATVWIVSQPFHLRRASFLFRREGLVPLPYAAADSIQYREPRLGLTWATREYVAWAHAFARIALRRVKKR